MCRKMNAKLRLISCKLNYNFVSNQKFRTSTQTAHRNAVGTPTYRCTESYSHLSNRRSPLNGCTDTPYRDSKGWLNAFGRVSFVTFLWRNKEKFFNLALILRVLPQSRQSPARLLLPLPPYRSERWKSPSLRRLSALLARPACFCRGRRCWQYPCVLSCRHRR